MRPLQIMPRPITAPGVCVMCGTQDREHFVDLGIDSEMHHVDDYGTRHLTEGVIYLCNICMGSVITEYLKQLWTYVDGQRVAAHLEEVKDSKAIAIMAADITNLQRELDKANAKIASMSIEEQAFGPEDVDSSGEDVLNNLLGDTDGDGSSESDADPGSSSGSDSESSTDDSGAEPQPEYDASDLSGIKSGLINFGSRT